MLRPVRQIRPNPPVGDVVDAERHLQTLYQDVVVDRVERGSEIQKKDLVFGQTWRRDEALLCLCGDAETLGSPSFSNVHRVFTDLVDLLGQARRRGEPLRCMRGETERPSSPELSHVSSGARPEKDELFVVFWRTP